MNTAEIKSYAKQNLQGNLGTLILILILQSAALSLGNFIPVVGSLLLVGPLGIGATCAFYLASRGNRPDVGQLFYGFSNCFGESFLAGFLQGIFIALWSMLFVIPGIVKTYSYAMTYYILYREPGISANEAITKSRQYMDGHKMELFTLHLSFIFWILLGIITCGLAFIYVGPYMKAAETVFFNKLYDNCY